MALHDKGKVISLLAAEDLLAPNVPRYSVVAANAADTTRLRVQAQSTGPNNFFVGILQDNVHEGEAAPVQIDGISIAIASEALVAGQKVTAVLGGPARGKVAAATADNLSSAIGTVIFGGAADEEVSILLEYTMVGMPVT